MKKRAVLIVGHGSRLAHFQRPMERLAAGLRKGGRYKAVRCCYLEITPPSLPVAIKICVERGLDEILVLPYFLLMGNHVKTDIPGLLKEAQLKYHGRVKIKLSPYLGYDERILSVVKRRLREAR